MSDAYGMRTEQDVYAALRELREEPYGVARSARTEEVAEAAERLELDEPLAQALLELLTAYEYGGEVRKAPVLFSRILRLSKEKPEAFDEWAAHRVFWCFKWITSALLALPEIPLASIEGWIAQMREHYTAAGKPLQAVHTSRYHLAAHTGVDQDTAYELWVTRPRDEFSDCEACEARNRGVYWARKGEDARALEEWRPVLDGELDCAEEPASTISYALLPLVRAGRTQEAASFHRSGYRATRGKVSMDGEVARHLEFLALTGNTARGVELLAENRGRFDAATDASTRLSFLGGVLLLLTRLVEEGGVDVPVSGPKGTSFPAAGLLAELGAEAAQIAASFDARNGTTAVGDRHRARLARVPLTSEPLALGLRAAPVAAMPAPAPAAEAAAAEPLPEDFTELLEKARAAMTGELPEAEAKALWRAVEERATEADLDDLLRAELADRATFAHVAAREWAEAAARLHTAADLFAQAGASGRALSRRSRAAWAACMDLAPNEPAPDAEPEAWAALWAELEAVSAEAAQLQARKEITDRDYVVIRHSRAATALEQMLVSAAGREAPSPEARAVFDREVAAFLEDAVRLGLPDRAAIAEALTSQVLHRDGRLEESLAHMEQAIGHAEASMRPWSMASFVAQRGVLLNALGRLEDAAQELHRALALAATWPATGLDTGALQMELAHNRMRADDPAGAIDRFTAAAAQFDHAGEALRATHARTQLGQALLRAERVADAVAVLESVLDEESEAELIPPERAQLRLDLGRALLQQDEPRTAAEVLTRLAEYVADWPEPEVVTLVAAELGVAVYAASLWDQGPATIERALAAHRRAPNSAPVCKMLRVAADAEYRRRAAEDGVTRALDLLRRADEINEATPEVDGGYRRWPETAMIADLRMLALAAAERDEEALAAALVAVAAWENGGDHTLGDTAETARIAAVIEGFRLGRPEDALARLSPMIARCRAAGHTRGVAALTKLAEDLRR